MAEQLMQWTPIGDHCIVFVLSQCLSSPRCINRCWLRNAPGVGGEGVHALVFSFTLIPNALEPSKTVLKGPKSATTLFLFIHKSLAIIFCSEHVKAKKITFKLLMIKVNTFRSGTLIMKQYDFASLCNINISHNTYNFLNCCILNLQSCNRAV